MVRIYTNTSKTTLPGRAPKIPEKCPKYRGSARLLVSCASGRTDPVCGDSLGPGAGQEPERSPRGARHPGPQPSGYFTWILCASQRRRCRGAPPFGRSRFGSFSFCDPQLGASGLFFPPRASGRIRPGPSETLERPILLRQSRCNSH